MVRILKVILTSLIIISVGHAHSPIGNYCQQFNDYVIEYDSAYESEQYFPQHQINSKEQAYLIQACIVSNKAQKVISFKAGLVSASSQNRFHADEPVLGVFTEKNLLDLSIDIYMDNRVSLIELELAFRLKQNIDDLADLNNEIIELVDAVAPAIEIPLFHFENTNALISNDIIAANVGANIVMLGDFVAIENVDIDSIKVGLFKDNKIIASSKDSNPINIRKSLKWMIKKSYLEGYDLKSGVIYLTGSLINPTVIEERMYQADYSQMKDMSLIVK